MTDDTAQGPRDLSALLVPLAGELLVLPSSVVAEIIRRRELERPAQAPAWLLGMLHWHEASIPVLCFEALNGGALSDTGHGGRIVILNALGEHAACRHYAVLAQGVPHLLLMTAADLQPDPARRAGPVEHMKVRVHGQDAAIPELGAVEAALAELSNGGR